MGGQPNVTKVDVGKAKTKTLNRSNDGCYRTPVFCPRFVVRGAWDARNLVGCNWGGNRMSGCDGDGKPNCVGSNVHMDGTHEGLALTDRPSSDDSVRILSIAPSKPEIHLKQ